MTKRITKKNILGKKYKSGNAKSFKKMNCHPSVKGKTVNKNSCFTMNILQHIKKSYNAKHPEKKITETEPDKLWNEVKSRINECDKEDCWLQSLDSKTQKQVDALSFAPDHPPEWKDNPDEWLSNFDIFNVLKQYEETYPNFKVIGPTPIDFDKRIPIENGNCVWKDLCTFFLGNYLKKSITKIGIVFNLDAHNEPGSHWVSLFIDLDDKIIFYLDSAGSKIPEEIDILVKRIQKQANELEPSMKLEFFENYPFTHQNGNTECGMYSLFFIITMLTGKIGKKTFKTKEEKIDYFKSSRIPDEYVFKYRNVYFNSN